MEKAPPTCGSTCRCFKSAGRLHRYIRRNSVERAPVSGLASCRQCTRFPLTGIMGQADLRRALREGLHAAWVREALIQVPWPGVEALAELDRGSGGPVLSLLLLLSSFLCSCCSCLQRKGGDESSGMPKAPPIADARLSQPGGHLPSCTAWQRNSAPTGSTGSNSQEKAPKTSPSSRFMAGIIRWMQQQQQLTHLLAGKLFSPECSGSLAASPGCLGGSSGAGRPCLRPGRRGAARLHLLHKASDLLMHELQNTRSVTCTLLHCWIFCTLHRRITHFLALCT